MAKKISIFKKKLHGVIHIESSIISCIFFILDLKNVKFFVVNAKSFYIALLRDKGLCKRTLSAPQACYFNIRILMLFFLYFYKYIINNIQPLLS